ncbi:MAG: hypothetical protein ACREQ5_03235 [Candidatus Dormibacteria bacterium]
MTAAANEIASFRELPEDKFDVIVNRPVFKEHTAFERYQDPYTGEEKERVIKYDRDTLEAICRNVNERVRNTGDYVALTIGHTPTRDEKIKGMPSPPVVGYAGPFHMEQIGASDPKWAIVADKFATFKSDSEVIKRNGRCSVEMFEVPDPTKRFFDPIALLGADMPRLALGITYSASGCEGYPVARYAMPATAGGSNTFVPGPAVKARYDDKGLPSEHTDITPEKAKTMLKEGEAKGHDLTDKQKGFLGAVAGKERHEMPVADQPPSEGTMSLSDEDVGRLVDAFMQTEEMQFVHSLMVKDQAKGDRNAEPPAATPVEQTPEEIAAAGQPLGVDKNAVPTSEPPPEFPGPVKQNTGTEIAQGKEHPDMTTSHVAEPSKKENYDMSSAVDVAALREELAQEKARYAQDKAASDARLAAVETQQQAERATLVTRARYSQVKELCQTHAVSFDETWAEAKDLPDAEFERHLATVRKYATRLNGSFIPVAAPVATDWDAPNPRHAAGDTQAAEAKMWRDPRFKQMVNRYANAGVKKSSEELRNEYAKLNGQPVEAAS